MKSALLHSYLLQTSSVSHFLWAIFTCWGFSHAWLVYCNRAGCCLLSDRWILCDSIVTLFQYTFTAQCTKHKKDLKSCFSDQNSWIYYFSDWNSDRICSRIRFLLNDRRILHSGRKSSRLHIIWFILLKLQFWYLKEVIN